MVALTKLRKWINRDDGRFFRIGNEPIGVFAPVGLLVLVVALVLRQVRAQAGIAGGWSVALGVVGLALLLHGLRHNNRT